MAAAPRDVRRLALQTLYQFDARGSSAEDASAVKELLTLTAEPGEEDDGRIMQQREDAASSAAGAGGAGKHERLFTAGDVAKAFDLAWGAFQGRATADAFMQELAPDWPAYRQAAVDRAILRLAHFEMTSGRVHPKIAVNEAVELAKEFSTEKSPAFVNGLLDKLLKKILGDAALADPAPSEPSPSAPPASPEPT